MGFFTGEIVEDGYKPSFIYNLLKPKHVTGNEINGLGEPQKRRATPVYHWLGVLKVPFNKVQAILIAKELFLKVPMSYVKKSIEFGKKEHSPVSETRIEKTPSEWTEAIKAFALANGAHMVRIKRMNSDWVYEGFEVDKKWIIVLGFLMDYEEFSKTPENEGGTEALRTYAHGEESAWKLAEWLTVSGWEAKGSCGVLPGSVTAIPAAIAAGFGELGKHGSIINRELGAAFRLGYVVTDVPLLEDSEDEFGADDFCTSCQICTNACPPQAIAPHKQVVRGEEKWYVDFDKCVPYFNDNMGCGICIAVCPWSREEVRPNLLEKTLKMKAKREALEE